VFDTTNRVIRCRGRAQALLARYSLDALILLPPDHYLTTVLLRKLHRQVGHMGMNAMTMEVRNEIILAAQTLSKSDQGQGHTRPTRKMSEGQRNGL
jgi:hypothetical protein